MPQVPTSCYNNSHNFPNVPYVSQPTDMLARRLTDKADPAIDHLRHVRALCLVMRSQ